MRIEEKLMWIADGPWKVDDYQECKEFVHSFGLTCDCVGWVTMKLQEKTLTLLQQIRKRADERQIFLRGFYEKELYDLDTEWYRIKPRVVKDIHGDVNPSYKERVCPIKGYKVPRGCHIFEHTHFPGVSEAFVRACKENGLTGALFPWIPDAGRFMAPSYYSLAPSEMVSRMAGTTTKFDKHSYNYAGVDRHTKRERYKKRSYDREKLLALYRQADWDGGHLEFLEDIMDSFQYALIPLMVDKLAMPETDFAYVYGNQTAEVLIRKTAAEKLIAARVLQEKELMPVPYFEEQCHSLLIQECEKRQFLEVLELEKLEKLQEEWKLKKRPRYVPTEKIALKALRKAKKEQKDCFKKALSNSSREKIVGTKFAAMEPYYGIANGGWISDEIAYFSLEDVEKETEEFLADIKQEEDLLEQMPDLLKSIVIGKAANGDCILLEPTETVLRYDHEDPEQSIRWNSLFEFFYEQLHG